MKQTYRSTGLTRGTLGVLGTSHVHIDGAENYRLVMEIIQKMEKRGNLGKFNHVYDFIAGQQREILPETYQSHTPELDGKEELDFFSTTLVHNRKDAIVLVNLIMKSLVKTPGIIIELEQVRALYDQNGWQQIKRSQRIRPITEREIKFTPSPSLPIEIHHQFDIPKQGMPPVSLHELLHYTETHHVVVGGWFVFEKENHWAYRSNAFVHEKDFEKIVENEFRTLDRYLKRKDYDTSLRTLVENVIGIWQV